MTGIDAIPEDYVFSSHGKEQLNAHIGESKKRWKLSEQFREQAGCDLPEFSDPEEHDDKNNREYG